MLLYVTKVYYILCNVVTCYLQLLRGVQCSYMFHCVGEFCAAALGVVMGCCMMCGVVFMLPLCY